MIKEDQARALQSVFLPVYLPYKVSSFSISSILNENIEEGNFVLYKLYIALAFSRIYLV